MADNDGMNPLDEIETQAVPPKRFISDEELQNWLMYHPPGPHTIHVHEAVRSEMTQMALWLNRALPEGPNKTICLRYLQKTAMFANAAVAIDTPSNER
jgi:hypothetical protein